MIVKILDWIATAVIAVVALGMALGLAVVFIAAWQNNRPAFWGISIVTAFVLAGIWSFVSPSNNEQGRR